MPVEFRADLHIHTCLSPCADLFMTPRNIIEKAASLGINMIAVCDHNSAENIAVTQDIGKKRGVVVIPGMEITSSEEVHILGLFNSLDRVNDMQKQVYAHLQPGENDEDAFGMQVVVNEDDEVLGFNKRLLIGATDLSIDQVVALIHGFQGIAVASHIDREGFGIIGQLGFIPPETGFDALEISSRTPMDRAAETFGMYRSLPWITSSDAHELEDVGRKTVGLHMNHATFEELCLALTGTDGRRVII
ncbi:MAG: PHP domain-containing protein [Nitrospirae bacterium]|nr:PHP domain-containing protein [Nitrospirota bacterium]